jgi:ribosomal protein S18 acetylase RimI-like enzyme
VLYRLYKPGDFAQLYAIEELCFEPPFRFSRAYLRQLVHSEFSATWIGEQDGRIAGFAVVEWAQDATAPEAYIQTIEVAPEHRRQGIGNKLLRRIESSAQIAGAGSIWLHVDSENEQAIRLYEAHGYRREGREEHYYARSRAALIYRKPLENLSTAA